MCVCMREIWSGKQIITKRYNYSYICKPNPLRVHTVVITIYGTPLPSTQTHIEGAGSLAESVRQATDCSVLGDEAVLQVYLGLSDEVIWREAVPVHHCHCQCVVLQSSSRECAHHALIESQRFYIHCI